MEHFGIMPIHIRATATTLPSLTTTTTTATTLSMEKPLSNKSSSDHRRSNKPIMEKRRRARINHCLGELKGLILEAMKKDPARHSKLEKADILEMTVKHLQNMQRQQMAIAFATDPSVMTKFRAGFNECATEVARYVSRIDGVEPCVRQRLLVHLRSCLTGLNYLTPATFACIMPESGAIGQAPFMPPPPPPPPLPPQSGLQPVHVQVSSPTTTAPNVGVLSQAQFNNNCDVAAATGGASRMFAGLRLVPRCLPNGDIAFVLPPQSTQLSPQSQESDDDQTQSGSRPPSAPPSPPVTTPPTPPILPIFPSNPLMATDNRRTPSAFTSVLNGSGSNTSPTFGSIVPHYDTATGNKNIPLLCIKREDPTLLQMSAPVGSLRPSELKNSSNNESSVSSSAKLRSTGSSCRSTKSQTVSNCESPYDLSRPSTSNVCSITDNDKMWRPW